MDPPKKSRLEKPDNRSSPITVQTSKDLMPNLNDYDETNADDFAMEMGLACVVCRCMFIFNNSVMFEFFSYLHLFLYEILLIHLFLCLLRISDLQTNDGEHGKPVSGVSGVS